MSFPLPTDTLENLHELETRILAEPLSATGWVDDICRHTLIGGKRIRPLLLLLSGGALGADRERCLQLAGTVELIHNATLLHDDVIDDAQMRRNRPNVNQLWSKKHGILAGDMLYARAFSLIADLEVAEVRRLLAGTACALAEAELLQLQQKSIQRTSDGSAAEPDGGENTDAGMDEQLYFRIVAGKTASLFRFCCLAPAMECGASGRIQQAMSKFGEQFGVAFQLTDDILDCIGDPQKTGKQIGTDLSDGNLTLPLARGMAQADAVGRRRIARALASSSPTKAQIEDALDAVRSTDAIAQSLEQCRTFVRSAIASLPEPPVPESVHYLDAMRALASQVLERTS